jgi:hypothetical protein
MIAAVYARKSTELIAVDAAPSSLSSRACEQGVSTGPWIRRNHPESGPTYYSACMIAARMGG